MDMSLSSNLMVNARQLSIHPPEVTYHTLSLAPPPLICCASTSRSSNLFTIAGKHPSLLYIAVTKSIYLLFHQWIYMTPRIIGVHRSFSNRIIMWKLLQYSLHSGTVESIQELCASYSNQHAHAATPSARIILGQTHRRKVVVTCSILPIEGDLKQANSFPVLVQLLYSPQ